MKATVIHHSADFDGLFCREIARKFLGSSAEYIGWDFADPPLPVPEGQIYVLDLPVDRVFGFDFNNPESVVLKVGDVYRMKELNDRLIWIDHHKSSIETHPTNIPGLRIDGVAACRLAWNWFTDKDAQENPEYYKKSWTGASKDIFVNREVEEPMAVRLAGEYDIWDKRDPNAEVFQFGLRSRELTAEDWNSLLSIEPKGDNTLVNYLLRDGRLLQRYQQGVDEETMHRSFLIEFEGLKFLALNTARCNSLTFASKDVPETGHDALLGFYYDGEKTNVSLYHAKHRTDLDLSQIAVKYGGGGHRGACGFRSKRLLFVK